MKSDKSNFKILYGTEELLDWEIRTNDKDELLIIDKMMGGGEIKIEYSDFYEWTMICDMIQNYLSEVYHE